MAILLTHSLTLFSLNKACYFSKEGVVYFHWTCTFLEANTIKQAYFFDRFSLNAGLGPRLLPTPARMGIHGTATEAPGQVASETHRVDADSIDPAE